MTVEKNKHVEWVDIMRPKAADLAALKKKFNLHPVIADELKGPSARARVEAYDGYLFFVYYFPKYDKRIESSVRTEIDFIVTKDAVATIHYEPVTEALQGLKVTTEKNSLALLHRLMGHLIVFEERELRHVREKVEAIGRNIFKDREREILERIAYLKRDISEYRIVVRLQEPVLQSLVAKGRAFWGNDAEVYLNDLAGEHLKVVRQLTDYRDAIADFEDTNNQLMNVKINSAMRTFTALSFLTFPFVLIAAIFSMRTVDTPLVNLPGGFWIIVGAMAVGIVSLFVYFRKRKWF
jgi:magnesium transporter